MGLAAEGCRMSVPRLGTITGLAPESPGPGLGGLTGLQDLQ